MGKKRIVTLARLNRVVRAVESELRHWNLWHPGLDDVNVFLVPAGFAYGWQMYRTTGHIYIPMVSACQIRDMVTGQYIHLLDIVRHEYAHAFAHTAPEWVKTAEFRRAFGASHDSFRRLGPYNPKRHITVYGSTNTCEDFADTWTVFLKARGRLPKRFDTPAIRRKWEFVRSLTRRTRKEVIAC